MNTKDKRIKYLLAIGIVVSVTAIIYKDRLIYLNKPDSKTVSFKSKFKTRTVSPDEKLGPIDIVAYLHNLDSDEVEYFQKKILIENSPEELIRIINSLAYSADALIIISPLFSELAKKDPKLALGLANRIVNTRVQGWAKATIIANVSIDDPDKAMAIAKAQDPKSYSLSLENIFRSLVETDPSRALEKWCQIGEDSDKARAGQVMLNMIAEKDPQLLLDYCDKNRKFSLANDARILALRELSKGDMPQALQYLSGLEIGENKLLMIKAVVSSADGQIHGDLLSDWISKNTIGKTQSLLMKELIPKIAEFDLTKAVSMLGDMPNVDGRDSMIDLIFSKKYNSSDPTGALKLIDQLPDRHDQETAFISILSKWANIAPDEALNFCNSQKQMDPAKATAMVLKTWSLNDPFATFDWIDANRENGSAYKKEDILYVFSKAASLDPERALVHLQKNELENSLEAKESLTYSWAKNNPKDAVSWIDTLSSNGERERMYSVLVSSWLSYDSISASRWVAGLVPGNEKDQAIVALFEGIAESDPQSAYEWAQQIKNSTLRDITLNRIPKK